MFGNRNYSGYSINSSPEDDPFKLGDALQVSKLKGSKLNVYFNPIRRSISSKDEIYKRNQHFEEFRQAINDKKYENTRSKYSIPKDVDKDVFEAFLRRYRVRPIRPRLETESKPAMRRAPLKTIKTVGVEVPSVYTEKAIYTLPKRRNIEMFVEIAKPVRRKEEKVEPENKLEEIVEEEPEQLPPIVIEQQLRQTRNEIDEATTQLQQIKNLLSQRKVCLEPVNEENEDLEEKSSRGRELVDKKCSPIQPRTQWTVKSYDVDRSAHGRKNKLMSTLNHLNQRLQRIQEKYFNEPKMKYKSVDDFVSSSKDGFQTLYENNEYGRSDTPANFLTVQEHSSVFDPETLNYMHELIKKSEEINNGNAKKRNSGGLKSSNGSVVMIMPPIEEFRQSEQIVSLRDIEQNTHNANKGILKKLQKSTETFDTILEAPSLQNSICKSNYLMKEFNLASDAKDFDLSILLQKNDANTSTESFKKNVRFSGSAKKVDIERNTHLNSNIDIALQNSLFYHDTKDQRK